jgi:predicted transcriptional regulator
MVRRSRLEIFFDVLAVIERGVREAIEKSKRYSITEKGSSALAYHLRSLEGLVHVQQLTAR